MDDCLLIVFTKNAVPGKVKTRLAREMGNEKACEIYNRLQEITCKAVLPFLPEVVVFFSDGLEPNHPIWGSPPFNLALQQGQDLGDRMHQAFQQGFAQGKTYLCLIGCDCPEISTEILSEAFQQLQQYEVVIGPALDGGYYLIGLQQPKPDLFFEMPWSTDQVAALTLARCQQLSLSVYLLPPLRDVDEPSDLAHFPFLSPPM